MLSFANGNELLKDNPNSYLDILFAEGVSLGLLQTTGEETFKDKYLYFVTKTSVKETWLVKSQSS